MANFAFDFLIANSNWQRQLGRLRFALKERQLGDFFSEFRVEMHADARHNGSHFPFPRKFH